MGIRDSFRQGSREGYRGGMRDVQGGGGASSQTIAPHLVAMIGEQLQQVCNGCENSPNGLGKGALKKAGRVAVFCCLKDEPGPDKCRVMRSLEGSSNPDDFFLTIPKEVKSGSALVTVVSVSIRR